MSRATKAVDRDAAWRDESAAAGRTIVELFRNQVRQRGTRPALRRFVDGRWEPLSWADYGTAVREIAAGLIDLGLGTGDRAALLSTNRAESSSHSSYARQR